MPAEATLNVKRRTRDRVNKFAKDKRSVDVAVNELLDFYEANHKAST